MYVKATAITLTLLLLISGGVWHFFLKPQVVFAEIATAYGAKQVCSCRFVGERDIKSCTGDFTQDIRLITFTEAPRTIQASVLAGWVKATAEFEPGLGCKLVNS